ncbi:MAG TPA: alkaline phosphatase family protein [Solirubrobacteraceae bacterium]|nr:alkaline phosphatase family protein [Solirubrobacteraceae bacterium]
MRNQPQLRRVRAGARPAAAALLAICALLLCGCGGHVLRPTQSTPSPRARTTAGRPGHIAVLVMENAEYSSVIGNPGGRFITDLAHRYALATQDYAITHPSLPNYLALTGGQTFGVTSDCTGCSVPGGGLGGQLDAHHIPWRAYMEDYPHPCFQGGSAGEYAKKHDPFLYYRAIAARAACRDVLPFTALDRAIAARRLPRFLWITPNLCHDMHDCSVHAGSAFLQSLVPGLLRALGAHGLLFLTWDEGSSNDGCCRLARGGHVALIVAGGGARAHARLGTPVDHYSVLQTIEDLLGLPRLSGAACGCTPSLQPLLAGRAG